MELDPDRDLKIGVGSVVQINESEGRGGWIGALAIVHEINAWGVMAGVRHIETHDKASTAFIRLPWKQVEFIGQAVLLPQDLVAEAQS